MGDGVLVTRVIKHVIVSDGRVTMGEGCSFPR